jgi:hypothetical protein
LTRVLDAFFDLEVMNPAVVYSRDCKLFAHGKLFVEV